MTYNIILVPRVLKNNSKFNTKLLHNVDLCSPCCTVSTSLLLIYFIPSCLYFLTPFPYIVPPSLSPLVTTSLFSLTVSLCFFLYSQFVVFFRFHMWVILDCIYICCLFDGGHSDRCKVRSHCGFDLHFPDDEQCWTSSCLLATCMSSSGKCLFWSSAHVWIRLFGFLIVSCISSFSLLVT